MAVTKLVTAYATLIAAEEYAVEGSALGRQDRSAAWRRRKIRGCGDGSPTRRVTST
jgi:hypothetical protein